MGYCCQICGEEKQNMIVVHKTDGEKKLGEETFIAQMCYDCYSEIGMDVLLEKNVSFDPITGNYI